MNKMISFGARLSSPYTPIPGQVLDPVEDVKEADYELLNMIYSRNPVDGLPSGDLAIFLSPNANPEVKMYIEQRLLQMRPEDSGANLPNEVLNKFKSTINDDDIAFFSRNHGETNEEFQDRLRLYLHDEKRRVKDRRDNAEIQAALKKAREREKREEEQNKN